MNRDVVSVIMGGFGTKAATAGPTDMSIYEGEHTEINVEGWGVLWSVRSASAGSYCLKISRRCLEQLVNSDSVIIVPGCEVDSVVVAAFLTHNHENIVRVAGMAWQWPKHSMPSPT